MNRRRIAGLSLALLGAAAVGFALVFHMSGSGPGGTPAADPVPSLGERQGPSAHERELARLSEEIAARTAAAAAHPDDGSSWEVIAGLLAERARLTGNFTDYREAEQALERAFSIAPEGSGPFLARARLHYALHRMRRVGPDLAAAERASTLSPADRREIEALRADVAFHTGDFATAERLYQEQLDAERSVAALIAMAQYRWKTARFEEAERLLEEAAGAGAREGATTRARIALVRGLYELDRGRLDAALAHYEAGLREVPGEAVLEAHVAEIRMKQGRLEEAASAW